VSRAAVGKVGGQGSVALKALIPGKQMGFSADNIFNEHCFILAALPII
jgi:hypothetical protein